MIEVENLSKMFGDTLALDSINLRIKKGETFGFVGPNGAGKTTAIRIMCGILNPSEGRVVIDGVDVSKDFEMVRRHRFYHGFPSPCVLNADEQG